MLPLVVTSYLFGGLSIRERACRAACTAACANAVTFLVAFPKTPEQVRGDKLGRAVQPYTYSGSKPLDFMYSCSSPVSYISRTMSQPPTNSPFT